MSGAPDPIRLLVHGPGTGARNMAVDEALMRATGPGGPTTLRFYRWQPACLSFGRNQAAVGRYDHAAIARDGVDVVRRPTGGRAVLHHRELTYAVSAPEETWGSLRDAYCRINQALAAGLRRLGVPVQCATRREGGRSPGPDVPRACFRDPLPGEVTVGAAKLVGSAQWRDGGALLQHGSILLHDDQARIGGLRTEPTGSIETGATALADHLDRVPPIEALVDVLAEGFRSEFARPVVPTGMTAAEESLVEPLQERYSDTEWTWRR